MKEHNEMSEPRRWMDYGTSGVMPPVEVVAAADYDALRARVEQYQRALEVLYTDESGDLDYIKWYITEKVLTIEARNAIDAGGLSGNKTAASNEVPK